MSTAVHCPKCGRQPGQRCITGRGVERMATHKERDRYAIQLRETAALDLLHSMRDDMRALGIGNAKPIRGTDAVDLLNTFLVKIMATLRRLPA